MSQTQTAVAPPEGAPDAGVPWHYGDPLGEQRLLDSGRGFVDLSHRPVIEVAGDDRLTWLHTLTSQHVSELPSGEWTQALILDANGRVEHHLDLVDDGERVLAHVEPGTVDALMEYLQKMVFWSKVELRVRADLGVVWRPGAAGMDGSDAFTFVDRAAVASLADPAAGTWAYEALRVAAGRPRLGLDTDHRTIPAEVNWIGAAVHLEKGCYRGQETVARVHNLGKPPRRLVRLHLDGSDDRLPTPGDALTLDGRTVGFVGSVVQHYELGPVALGLLKRQVPDDAAVLAVAGGSADGAVSDAGGVRCGRWPGRASGHLRDGAAAAPLMAAPHEAVGHVGAGWLRTTGGRGDPPKSASDGNRRACPLTTAVNEACSAGCDDGACDAPIPTAAAPGGGRRRARGRRGLDPRARAAGR